MRKLKKNIWPYQIGIEVEHNDPVNDTMLEWCSDLIGIRFKDWYSYYSYSLKIRVYAFKDRETLLIFKLKWGQHVNKETIQRDNKEHS